MRLSYLPEADAPLQAEPNAQRPFYVGFIWTEAIFGQSTGNRLPSFRVVLAISE